MKKYIVSLLLLASSAIAQGPTKLEIIDEKQPQIRRLGIIDWLEGGEVKLTGPLPSFVKVWLADDPKQSPLEFGFNKDASEISIYLPKKNLEGQKSATLNFLITEKSAVHPDGSVVFSALDSDVVGKQAKLETHPGSHRIGFWGNANDSVRWDGVIPEGDYRVELVYSRASKTGTEVAISVGEKSFPLVLETTGSWYHYRVAELGEVSVPKAESHSVETRVTKIVNGGVMNLKAIVLTPTTKK
ncbi:MAG: hypothetical protein ACKVJU_01790 [Verrucomicrobiales bacterium]